MTGSIQSSGDPVKGTGWLDKHPERDLITRRYLGGKGQLVRDAQEQLGPAAEEAEEEEETE